jgi:hypothetical protein
MTPIQFVEQCARAKTTDEMRADGDTPDNDEAMDSLIVMDRGLTAATARVAALEGVLIEVRRLYAEKADDRTVLALIGRLLESPGIAALLPKGGESTPAKAEPQG